MPDPRRWASIRIYYNRASDTIILHVMMNDDYIITNYVLYYYHVIIMRVK